MSILIFSELVRQDSKRRVCIKVFEKTKAAESLVGGMSFGLREAIYEKESVVSELFIPIHDKIAAHPAPPPLLPIFTQLLTQALLI